jgi:hypothetical protein
MLIHKTTVSDRIWLKACQAPATASCSLAGIIWLVSTLGALLVLRVLGIN